MGGVGIFCKNIPRERKGKLVIAALFLSAALFRECSDKCREIRCLFFRQNTAPWWHLGRQPQSRPSLQNSTLNPSVGQGRHLCGIRKVPWRFVQIIRVETVSFSLLAMTKRTVIRVQDLSFLLSRCKRAFGFLREQEPGRRRMSF
jgi:hypothetical protein